MNLEHGWSGQRIMMYSQDGLGLGHMRRTSSIASHLLQQRSDACVLTLTDSQLGQFFTPLPRQDYVKLPSIVKMGPGNWRGVSLPLTFEKLHRLRTDIIRSAALSFQPHLLLVDHMPHGAMGELLPTLHALRACGSNTKIILGLRDILDAPEVVRKLWHLEGAFEAIERYYDGVLVYGDPNVFDMAERYTFSAAVRAQMHYSGYVCTLATPRYTARARAKYLTNTPTNTKLIVAMAGGGADAYPMMRTLLDALPAIVAQQPCMLALVTGPFMSAQLRRDLEVRARGLPARVSITVSDTLSYIEAADLVVAMAGYNTTMEILRWGQRALLIPRSGPSAEQRTRAELFAARRWVSMVDPDTLEASSLAEAVVATLAQPARAATLQQPNLCGVEAAGSYLLSLLPVVGSQEMLTSLVVGRPTVLA